MSLSLKEEDISKSHTSHVLAEDAERKFFENIIHSAFLANPIQVNVGETPINKLSPSFTDNLGFTLDDFVEPQISKAPFWYPYANSKGQSQEEQYLSELIQNGRVKQAYALTYNKKGDILHTKLNSRFQKDKNGKITGIQGFLENITDDIKRIFRTHLMLETRDQIMAIQNHTSALDKSEYISDLLADLPKFLHAELCSIFSYDYQRNVFVLEGSNHLEAGIVIPYDGNSNAPLMTAFRLGQSIVGINGNIMTDNGSLGYDDLNLRRTLEYDSSDSFIIKVEKRRENQRKYPMVTCLSNLDLMGYVQDLTGKSLLKGYVDTYVIEAFEADDFKEIIIEEILGKIQLFGPSISQGLYTVKKHEEETSTDGLTGLYNRATLDQFLQRDFNNAKTAYCKSQATPEYCQQKRRYELPPDISIIMGDLDFFKKINDTYGHLMADEVLKNAAAIFKSAGGRFSDYAARYGGEELVLVLPGAPYERAMHIAQEIRAKIDNSSSNNLPHATISLGVVSYPNEKITTYQDLLLLADKAMYRAKETGKNKVVGILDL